MQNNRIIRSNKYDKLIMLLLSLQVFGLFGGAWRPVRLFVYCCIPFVIAYFFRHKKAIKHYNFEISFFIFWLIYAFISLIWVIDLGSGGIYFYHLVASFFTFFTIIWLAEKAINPQVSIIKGWIILVALTLPLAFYEIAFDWHLPLSVQEEDMTVMNAGIAISRRFASVTFGNLNTYNLVLCYSLPFILLGIILFTKRRHLYINLFILFSLCFIIILNSSRGAILTLSVGLLLFLMYYLVKGKSRVLVFGFVLVGIFFIIQHFESLFEVILFRFENRGFEDDTRSELAINALDALQKSNFMGVGVGNMTPVLQSVYNMRIAVTHNLFLEILLQYGIFIFSGFLLLLWRIGRKGIRSDKFINKWFICLIFGVLLISSIIDASYLAKVYIWLFLGSISVVIDKRYSLGPGTNM